MSTPLPNGLAVPKNETARVRAYEDFQRKLSSLRRSSSPADRAAFGEMRRSVHDLAHQSLDDVARQQRSGPSPGSVHASTFMANMSVQYANEAYIVDELLPILPTDKLADQYAVYTKRDRLAYPDDAMIGRSSANEISESRTPETFACAGYALKKALEKKTVDNQDDVFDEMMDLTAQVADGMAFKREKRGMAILAAAGSYGANTAVIAAPDRWDTVAGGTPIKTIRTAVHSLWRGNGPAKKIGFCPISVYLALSTNPTILEVTKCVQAGFVPKDILAALFELDDLLIAKAWEDTANEGQAASVDRILTSKVFGIVCVAERPSKRNVSFGYNFRFKGEIVNQSWYKPEEGTRGTYYNQQSCDEVMKITAADAGYLLTTVIS